VVWLLGDWATREGSKAVAVARGLNVDGVGRVTMRGLSDDNVDVERVARGLSSGVRRRYSVNRGTQNHVFDELETQDMVAWS
jgi:hypothetical protein